MKIAVDTSQVKHRMDAVRGELAKVLVGQAELVDRLMVALLTGGHVLLEGVPGLAKSLTVSSLAQCLDLDFSRIQFTPDLLPADLVGTLIYNQREGDFRVRKGPVFANLILADEINRAPAKVQSALLEAMQERQVTIGDETYPLNMPFVVMATQNPIDQEGTYALPEAQMDRFLFRVHLDYPSREEERQILRRMAVPGPPARLAAVLHGTDIMALRTLIPGVRIEERLEHYILNLVEATRYPARLGLPQLQPYIEYGASPRGSIALALAARGRALLEGRDYATPEDVKAQAADVLNHRIITTYEADAERLTGRDLVRTILDKVPI
ncbi:MAG: AAA family ATPase [Sphingobacteriia bacterium]